MNTGNCSRDQPFLPKSVAYRSGLTSTYIFARISFNMAINKCTAAYGTPFVTKIHLFLGVLLAYKDSF